MPRGREPKDGGRKVGQQLHVRIGEPWTGLVRAYASMGGCSVADIVRDMAADYHSAQGEARRTKAEEVARA